MVNTFGQNQTEQSYGLGSNNQNQSSSSLYNNPNCYMRFDGKNLNLFANNQKVNSLIKNVKDIEEQYLNNDPSQRVFEKGHKNRFNKY